MTGGAGLRRVVPDVKVSTFSLFKGLAATVVLFVAMVSLFGKAGIAMGVGAALPGWLMLSMLIGRANLSSARKRVAAEARTALTDACGGRPMAVDADAAAVKSRSSRITGEGIAWDGERLWFVEQGHLGSVPFEKVREWHWEIAGRAVYRGGQAVATAMDNMQEAARQHAASGLFVKVADLDKPVWQFTTTDRQVLERWMELLTQVGEGLHRKGSTVASGATA